MKHPKQPLQLPAKPRLAQLDQQTPEIPRDCLLQLEAGWEADESRGIGELEHKRCPTPVHSKHPERDMGSSQAFGPMNSIK